MIHAPGCICGKHLYIIEPALCSWCGRGQCETPKHGHRRSHRLPRDLGQLQREGRRPDLAYENVVRLDRLPKAFSTMREAA